MAGFRPDNDWRHIDGVGTQDDWLAAAPSYLKFLRGHATGSTTCACGGYFNDHGLHSLSISSGPSDASLEEANAKVLARPRALTCDGSGCSDEICSACGACVATHRDMAHTKGVPTMDAHAAQCSMRRPYAVAVAVEALRRLATGADRGVKRHTLLHMAGDDHHAEAEEEAAVEVDMPTSAAALFSASAGVSGPLDWVCDDCTFRNHSTCQAGSYTVTCGCCGSEGDVMHILAAAKAGGAAGAPSASSPPTVSLLLHEALAVNVAECMDSAVLRALGLLPPGASGPEGLSSDAAEELVQAAVADGSVTSLHLQDVTARLSGIRKAARRVLEAEAKKAAHAAADSAPASPGRPAVSATVPAPSALTVPCAATSAPTSSVVVAAPSAAAVMPAAADEESDEGGSEYDYEDDDHGNEGDGDESGDGLTGALGTDGFYGDMDMSAALGQAPTHTVASSALGAPAAPASLQAVDTAADVSSTLMASSLPASPSASVAAAAVSSVNVNGAAGGDGGDEEEEEEHYDYSDDEEQGGYYGYDEYTVGGSGNFGLFNSATAPAPAPSGEAAAQALDFSAGVSAAVAEAGSGPAVMSAATAEPLKWVDAFDYESDSDESDAEEAPAPPAEQSAGAAAAAAAAAGGTAPSGSGSATQAAVAPPAAAPVTASDAAEAAVQAAAAKIQAAAAEAQAALEKAQAAAAAKARKTKKLIKRAIIVAEKAGKYLTTAQIISSLGPTDSSGYGHYGHAKVHTGTGYSGTRLDGVINSILASLTQDKAQKRDARALQAVQALCSVFSAPQDGASTSASSGSSCAGVHPCPQDAMLLQLLLGPGVHDGLSTPWLSLARAPRPSSAKWARRGRVVSFSSRPQTIEGVALERAPNGIHLDGTWVPSVLPLDTPAVAINSKGVRVLMVVRRSTGTLGAGDGLTGPSALHTALLSYLDTSAATLDAAHESTRALAEGLAGLVQALAAYPSAAAGGAGGRGGMLPAILYVPGFSPSPGTETWDVPVAEVVEVKPGRAGKPTLSVALPVASFAARAITLGSDATRFGEAARAAAQSAAQPAGAREGGASKPAATAGAPPSSAPARVTLFAGELPTLRLMGALDSAGRAATEAVKAWARAHASEAAGADALSLPSTLELPSPTALPSRSSASSGATGASKWPVDLTVSSSVGMVRAAPWEAPAAHSGGATTSSGAAPATAVTSGALGAGVAGSGSVRTCRVGEPLADPTWSKSALAAAVAAIRSHYQRRTAADAEAEAEEHAVKRRRVSESGASVASGSSGGSTSGGSTSGGAHTAASAGAGGAAGGAIATAALATDMDLVPMQYTAPADLRARYERLMRDEAYDEMDGLVDENAILKKGSTGAPAGTGSGGANAGRRRMKLAADLSTLPSLAVHWGSSIMVRYDAACMDVMRAVITGPQGTPYANGLFSFDILMPASYPAEPPKVLFLTTGGGCVRFNPNLYAEGKVCLSLLGTWSGPGWVPGISTLSQVLLALQAQILVDNPVVNEPSLEGAPSEQRSNRGVVLHAISVRLATLRHALLEPLKRPPRGFENAVRVHFWLKREELIAQACEWAAEAAVFAAYPEGLVENLRALRTDPEAVRSGKATLAHAELVACASSVRTMQEVFASRSVGSTPTRFSSSQEQSELNGAIAQALRQSAAKAATPSPPGPGSSSAPAAISLSAAAGAGAGASSSLGASAGVPLHAPAAPAIPSLQGALAFGPIADATAQVARELVAALRAMPDPMPAIEAARRAEMEDEEA